MLLATAARRDRRSNITHRKGMPQASDWRNFHAYRRSTPEDDYGTGKEYRRNQQKLLDHCYFLFRNKTVIPRLTLPAGI
jgi:hypothetical protein